MGQSWPDGYSATVEIYLLVAGERFDVAQVANGTLMLRDSRPIPAETNATLVMRVDQKIERTDIFLRDGAPDNAQFVPYF